MAPLLIFLAINFASPPGDLGQRPMLQHIGMPTPLHDALMKKLGGMSAAGQPVQNENVTALLQSYFPKGQAFEETRKVARDNGLGELEPFKGRTNESDGKMYVSRVTLMDPGASDIFIVLQFGFTQAKTGLLLDHVGAYVRANHM